MRLNTYLRSHINTLTGYYHWRIANRTQKPTLNVKRPTLDGAALHRHTHANSLAVFLSNIYYCFPAGATTTPCLVRQQRRLRRRAECEYISLSSPLWLCIALCMSVSVYLYTFCARAAKRKTSQTFLFYYYIEVWSLLNPSTLTF